MRGIFTDHSGRRYGRLTPVHFLKRQGWLCQCLCGGTIVVKGGNLTMGRVKSCGCLVHEATTFKHKATGTSEYICWKSIKARCFNSRRKDFHLYGGRGISICDEWKDNFEAFFSHMGPKPSKSHSIDRIDTNGNYEPGNCRWATPKEQGSNKRPFEFWRNAQ